MRRLSPILMLVMLAVAAAACGDGGGEITDDATDTTAAATTVPTTAAGTTVPATSLTLRITDVRLLNSEESDNGMRVLLPAGVASASVTMAGLPSPNRVINVCQARELDRRMTGATCRTPASGEAVTVPLGSVASGVEIVQVGVAGTGPEGNSAVLEEVTIRYAAPSRELNVRLPQIAAGESGGRPTFGLTPASADGSYRASLTWSAIAVFGGTPTNGQLELLQAGAVVQTQSSGGEVRLSGTLTPPAGDTAIRVQNIGGAALVTPRLILLLP